MITNNIKVVDLKQIEDKWQHKITTLQSQLDDLHNSQYEYIRIEQLEKQLLELKQDNDYFMEQLDEMRQNNLQKENQYITQIHALQIQLDQQQQSYKHLEQKYKLKETELFLQQSKNTIRGSPQLQQSLCESIEQHQAQQQPQQPLDDLHKQIAALTKIQEQLQEENKKLNLQVSLNSSWRNKFVMLNKLYHKQKEQNQLLTSELELSNKFSSKRRSLGSII